MADFLTEIRKHVTAGFGGISVHTVETYDMLQTLCDHQHDLRTVVLHFAPNNPLQIPVTSNLGLDGVLSDPPIGTLTDLLKSINDLQRGWRVQVVALLRNVMEVLTAGMEPGVLSSVPLVQLAQVLHREIVDAELDIEDPKNWLARFRIVVVLQNLLVGDNAKKNGAIIQALQDLSYAGRFCRVTFLLQTYEKEIDYTLQTYYPDVKFPLPNREESNAILFSVLSTVQKDLEKEDLGDLELACRGLTRRQIEDTAAILGSTEDALDPNAYKRVKIEAAENANLMKVIDVSNPGKLFGLEGAMQFLEPLIDPLQEDNPKTRTKGLLLAGPPGSGKSHFVQLIAKESNRTLCQVDLGLLRSKWIGETEERMHRMFKTVESLAPCILFLDELEKALSGIQSSGETDGGLGSRVLGMFLTWAQEKKEDALLVVTTNNIQSILEAAPETLRAERFDARFMVDLPTAAAREQMWNHYIKEYGVKNASAHAMAINSEFWTGAEIKTCCRLAAKRKVKLDAQAKLTPIVYNIAKDTIDGYRKFADGQFISAETGKLYKFKSGKQEGGIGAKPRDVN